MLHNHGRPGVTPMLVIWGPGAPELPEGWLQVGEVWVCVGSRARDWRAALCALPPRLDPGTRAALHAEVARHVVATEDWVRAVPAERCPTPV
jgi:hypothetical protein